ncbi:MAG: ABC transporter substrate-binding protein, partial [Alphaproteobacteria bacterium]
MSAKGNFPPKGLNRRAFLATTAAATAVGAMAGGMPRPARANTPKRGGVLRYASRVDGRGLDPHRNFVYYVSNPMALTTMGLVDLDKNMGMAPGVASEWESNKDFTVWTFRLRQGAEYHNNRTIDAESVKWNIERILDPTIGHAFTRSAVEDVEKVVPDGKWLV